MEQDHPTPITNIPADEPAVQPTIAPDSFAPMPSAAPPATTPIPLPPSVPSVEPTHAPQTSVNPLSPFATPLPVPPSPSSPHAAKMVPVKAVAAILSVTLLLIAVYGGYWYGKRHAATTKTPSTIITETSLQVPKGAVVIDQCAAGLGTQYVLPKDIPHGPVYNVWKNKVIGLEYMVGMDETMDHTKMFDNLPLSGVKYDHVNIGSEDAGHAGFPGAHYHVDIFTISDAAAKQITCA